MKENASVSPKFTHSRWRNNFTCFKNELVIFAIFYALTLAMTYPWILHLRDAIADTYDSYNFVWLLWWDYHQTFHDPLHLFNANIFYPYNYTLAFGEHNYGIALLFFPLFALGLNPVTVAGIATLTAFAACGYGAFRLARTLGCSNGAAWVCGIAFAFAPYRFHKLIHLNYIFAAWLPLVLEALILFVRRRSWSRAAWLGVAFLMNGLSSTTWFALSLVPLFLSGVVLILFYRVERDIKFWWRGGIALVSASLAMLPFMLPHLWLAKHYNFVRQPEDLAPYTAHLINWLAAEPRMRFWRGLNNQAARAEVALFPGLLPILLMLFGLIFIRRRSEADENSFNAARLKERYLAFALGAIWLVTGFCGSFGLNFIFYRLLFKYFYIFRGMRVPARWAMIFWVGLSLLAGLGAQSLIALIAPHLKRAFDAARLNRIFTHRAWMKSFDWTRIIIYALIILALLFEDHAAPLDLERAETKPDELTARLKNIPMRGGLVELPIGAGARTQMYILHTIYHEHPLVTATASFTPPLIGEIESLTHQPKIPDRLLDVLESVPTSYIVVHQGDLSPERRLAFEDFLRRGVNSGRLRFIRRYGTGFRDDDLYAVTKVEPNAPSESAPPPPVSEAIERAQVSEAQNALPREYQRFGFFVYDLHKTMTGQLPRRAQFIADVEQLNRDLGSDDAGEKLANVEHQLVAKNFADENLQREYAAKSDEEYVNALLNNAGVNFPNEKRNSLIEALKRKSETRLDALEQIAEDPLTVWMDCNRAFVLMDYFYYLRRNPDDPPDGNLEGLNFWTQQLDATNDYREIDHAFATSAEAEQAQVNARPNEWAVPREIVKSLRSITSK